VGDQVLQFCYHAVKRYNFPYCALPEILVALLYDGVIEQLGFEFEEGVVDGDELLVDEGGLASEVLVLGAGGEEGGEEEAQGNNGLVLLVVLHEAEEAHQTAFRAVGVET
jgi:hypothetical protein